MFSHPYPPEIGDFIERQIALGHYRSEEDLVVDAVRIMREVNDQQRQFAEDVQQGMDQLDRGEVNCYDENGLAQRFEELKNRALRHPSSSEINP
jgi:Arc/MetJ-type ribon-helix-helix transcriptional regulator